MIRLYLHCNGCGRVRMFEDDSERAMARQLLVERWAIVPVTQYRFDIYCRNCNQLIPPPVIHRDPHRLQYPNGHE